MNRYLIIKRKALFEDGWTYGDWRQYVAWRDDGTASCVRMSRLPGYLSLLGVCLLSLAATVVFADWSTGGLLPLAWGRLFWLTFAGFAALGLAGWFTVTPWRLTVIVGKVRKRPDEPEPYAEPMHHNLSAADEATMRRFIGTELAKDEDQ